MQFVEFMTLNVYVPLISPLILQLVPVPVVLISPGFVTIIHEPDEGSPVSSTLPVERLQVGCVTAPVRGAEGNDGGWLITAFAEAADTQPAALLTVKLYVPAFSPVTFMLVPVPVVSWLSGRRVSLQLPSAGSPVSVRLPSGCTHDGCAMLLTEGAWGTGFTARV